MNGTIYFLATGSSLQCSIKKSIILIFVSKFIGIIYNIGVFKQ